MSGSRVISEQQLEQHRSFSGPGLLVGLVGGEAAPAPAIAMIAAGIDAAVGDLVQVCRLDSFANCDGGGERGDG